MSSISSLVGIKEMARRSCDVVQTEERSIRSREHSNQSHCTKDQGVHTINFPIRITVAKEKKGRQ